MKKPLEPCPITTPTQAPAPVLHGSTHMISNGPPLGPLARGAGPPLYQQLSSLAHPDALAAPGPHAAQLRSKAAIIVRGGSPAKPRNHAGHHTEPALPREEEKVRARACADGLEPRPAGAREDRAASSAVAVLDRPAPGPWGSRAGGLAWAPWFAHVSC